MSPLSQSERDDLRTHVVQSYCQTARKEHARILQRRQIIEERKEELENLNVQRVRGRLTGGVSQGVSEGGGVQGGTGKPQCSEGEGAAHGGCLRGGARRNWETSMFRG